MRCYDGAWDSEAQALFKEQDDLMAQIKTFEPQAFCTFHNNHGEFPGGFQVHAWGRPLGPFRNSMIGALYASLEALKVTHATP